VRPPSAPCPPPWRQDSQAKFGHRFRADQPPLGRSAVQGFRRLKGERLPPGNRHFLYGAFAHAAGAIFLAAPATPARTSFVGGGPYLAPTSVRKSSLALSFRMKRIPAHLPVKQFSREALVTPLFFALFSFHYHRARFWCWARFVLPLGKIVGLFLTNPPLAREEL